MLFNIIAGTLYFLVFSFLTFRIVLKKWGKTEAWWMTVAFAFKVTAGMIYGYLYAHYFEVSDSWAYFEESLLDYHEVLHHPSSIFSYKISWQHFWEPFSSSHNAFWSNAGENLLIKLLVLFNVLSGGNYYINVILFNVFSFLGLCFLYLTARAYIRGNTRLLFMTIFFLPACLFWNSGIDKDGLIVFFTGVLIFAVHRCISKSVNFQRITVMLISAAFLLLLRNINAVLLLPALIAWWISAKMKKVSWLPFLLIYSFCILFFFGSVYLPSNFNLPRQLAVKQHLFLQLEAGTVLPLTPLKPDFLTYLKVLPEAVNHVFFRPYITEIKSPFHLMAFMELLLIIGFLLFSMWKARKQQMRSLLQPFSLFAILVALSGLLLIGFTVPFPGAIIRFRALYDALLVIPFIELIRTKK